MFLKTINFKIKIFFYCLTVAVFLLNIIQNNEDNSIIFLKEVNKQNLLPIFTTFINSVKKKDFTIFLALFYSLFIMDFKQLRISTKLLNKVPSGSNYLLQSIHIEHLAF